MMAMEDEEDPVTVEIVAAAAATPATASAPRAERPTGSHGLSRNDCQPQQQQQRVGGQCGTVSGEKTEDTAVETHPTDDGDGETRFSAAAMSGEPTTAAPRTITPPPPPPPSVFRGTSDPAGLCHTEYAPTAGGGENHEYYWGTAANSPPAEFCTGSSSPPTSPGTMGHHHHHHNRARPRRRRFYSSPSSSSSTTPITMGHLARQPRQRQQQQQQQQQPQQGDEHELVWGSLSFDDAAAAARWNAGNAAATADDGPPRFDAAASQRPRRRRRTESYEGPPEDRRPSSSASAGAGTGGVEDEDHGEGGLAGPWGADAGFCEPPTSALRSSLDAGMAALRRRAERLFGKRGGGGGGSDDGSGASDEYDDDFGVAGYDVPGRGGGGEFGDHYYHASGLSNIGTTSSLRLRRRHRHMMGPHRQRSAPRAMLTVPRFSASEDAMDLGFDESMIVRNRDQRAYSEPNGSGLFRGMSWGDQHLPPTGGEVESVPPSPPFTATAGPPLEATVVVTEEMTGSAPPPSPPTGDVTSATTDAMERPQPSTPAHSASAGGDGFGVVVHDEPSVASSSSVADDSRNHVMLRGPPDAHESGVRPGSNGDGGGATEGGSEERGDGEAEGDEDEEEQRRRRQEEHEEEQRRRQRQQQQWIRINHYFQCLITLVALMFSMILFAILVCWVVLTSAYVVSIDKVCDVPLKRYYWFATLQLILDVFRTDIMKHVFRWDPNSRQQQRIPSRVIVYNLAYISFAIIVLKTGIESVFASQGATCSKTAPELFQTSKVFVSLSILAWSTIVIGYIIPFCFLAILLTRSGYSTRGAGAQFFNAGDGAGVTPGAGFRSMFNNREGADPRCIDQLRVVLLEEFPDHYPKECCICMGDFAAGEVIVVTQCEHVFHKSCCREWLRQARTCPVCRTDIPTALGMDEDAEDTEAGTANVDRNAGVPSNDGDVATEPSVGSPAVQEEEQRRRLGGDEFNREVANLLRILRQHEERLRQEQALHDPSIEGEDDRTIVLSRDSGTSSGAVSLRSDRSNTSRRDSRQNSTLPVEAAEEGRIF